jgi:hypothetical protein
MKNLVCIALFSLAVLGFTACGSSQSDEEKKALDSLTTEIEKATNDIDKALDTIAVSMDTTVTTQTPE